MRPHPRLTHSEYYRDRSSESELCYDFPGDEILIDGLHAMQMHFWNNNRNIDIPVVRVMNAAHYLAAYMFETTCSGDQTEYDVLAYASVGKDRQLAFLTIIVLAAMLKRTEGLRAKSCRNLILEDRSEDFEEGVTLYERFLRTAEERFAEEDFLIDIPALAIQLREKDELIAQQSQQIATLENTITTMEEKYTQIIGTQYKQDNNQGTIYNGPVTINQYPASPSSVSSADPDIQSPSSSSGAPDFSSETLFCRITKAAHDKGKAQQVESELRSACVSAPKLVKAIRTNEALGYLDTQNLSSVDLYDLLNEHFGLTFKQRNFDYYRSK